jgi:hypothetical protein
MDIVHLAASVTTTLAPYLSKLLASAVAVGQWGVGEGKAHAAGIARELWSVIKPHLVSAPKLESSARVVADDADDEDARALFAKRLAEQLAENAQLLQQIEAVFARHEEALQQVTADSGALVRRVQQTMEGGGKQIVRASDGAAVEDVLMSKR